jgi:HK97 family phage portal protein
VVEDYAALYRTQPNVRLCVRFLGRMAASLPLKGYRRVSFDEREELPSTHELAQVLKSPFPAAPKPPTRHRFVRTMVEDLAIFDRYYAVKIRNTNTGRLNIVRVPPQMMKPVGGTWIGPAKYELFGSGPSRFFEPSDVIHLFGHDPANPNDGVSPLEALRRVLAEDSAAGEYREQFWKNAARVPGVLTRPAEVPKWSDPARERFLEDWRATWTGSGTEAGGTPVLEEGMTFEQTGFSAKDSEYLGARRLSREEAAALFHIPPAFVGILENANFANMREQHVGLYVDTLGPWLDWITTELEIQLLPDLADVDDVYVDFSLEAKLAGNFEEQATAIQSSTGAPWMTRNEARALRNLPPVEGGDALVVPLNVLVGGLASPTDTAPPAIGAAGRPSSSSKHQHQHGTKSAPAYRAGWEAKHLEVLTAFFERQKNAVLSRLGARNPVEVAFDVDRWNEELGVDLLALSSSMAEDLGGQMAAEWGGEFSLDRALPYLRENARISAEKINATTYAALAEAVGVPSAASRSGSKLLDDLLLELDGVDLLDDETPDDPTDPVVSAREVFAVALAARAAQIATSRTTSLGEWSRREGAGQAGVRTKTWNVNASPSRHGSLDGETVGLDETFSNGAQWPGDPILPADESAGCLCSLTFGN